MKWFRQPPDLTVSNEYQQLSEGGCINCNALLEVLKAGGGYGIVSKRPSVSQDESGCWAYCDNTDYYPACLHGLKDNDPKVIQARNEILHARYAMAQGAKRAARDRREREKKMRKIQNRPLP